MLFRSSCRNLEHVFFSVNEDMSRWTSCLCPWPDNYVRWRVFLPTGCLLYMSLLRGIFWHVEVLLPQSPHRYRSQHYCFLAQLQVWWGMLDVVRSPECHVLLIFINGLRDLGGAPSWGRYIPDEDVIPSRLVSWPAYKTSYTKRFSVLLLGVFYANYQHTFVETEENRAIYR